MLRRRRAAIINKQSVPYGMEKVEYLESPLEGKTYINTGILPDGNVFIDTYAAVANDLNGYESYVCGSNTYGNGVVERGVILLAKLANDFQQKVWFGNKNHQFAKISDCDKHRWVFKDKKLSIDNELIYDFSDVETTTSNAPLVVFGDGNRWINSSPGYIGTVDGGSNTKIFSFQMRCNDKSINLIPSIDKTGTPCMFDLVSRKNFYNAGTGQFIYPTSSTTYSLRRPQAEWAKITDTGVHKIYHTPIGYEGYIEDYAIENGYKRLIETESPNEEGKYYSFKWVETDDTLTTEWFEIDPPQEEIIEENLDNPTE